MKQHILVAAIVGAIALPAHAAQPATAENADVSGDATVTFSDGPTGFNFVWGPDTGWKFVGQNRGANANGGLVKTALASSKESFQEGAPLAEFVDASTGFRFVYRYGIGWQFDGPAGSPRGELQRIATLAGNLR